MTENEISYHIRGAVFDVYNQLGPGLLESVYQHVLSYELELRGFNINTEVAVPVIYKDKKLDLGFRLDILVNQKVFIELKSVENLHDVHHKQVITYLKLTGMKLGLLINFNSSNISGSIHRKVNGL